MRRTLHTLVEQSIKELMQRYFSLPVVSKTQMIDAVNHPEKYKQLILEHQGKKIDFMHLSREQQVALIKRVK